MFGIATVMTEFFALFRGVDLNEIDVSPTAVLFVWLYDGHVFFLLLRDITERRSIGEGEGKRKKGGQGQKM